MNGRASVSPQRAFGKDASELPVTRDRLDSLLSAVRTKRFFWQDDATPINDDPPQRPCRQDIAGTLMENRHADYRLDSLAVA